MAASATSAADAAAATAAASAAVWLSGKVLADCQPKKLADFTARCAASSGRGPRGGTDAAAVAATTKAATTTSTTTTLVPTEERPSPRSQRRQQAHLSESLAQVPPRGSAAAWTPAAARPQDVGRSALPTAPARTSCAYGQTALRQRVPHEHLLTPTQYRYLLAQFTRPPAQEQVAKWHRDLRNYSGSRSGGATGGGNGTAPTARARAALDGRLRRARLRSGGDGSGSRSGTGRRRADGGGGRHAGAGGSGGIPAAKDLRTDPARARLRQGLRELDASTRRLRRRYSLLPPHDPPSAQFAAGGGSGRSVGGGGGGGSGSGGGGGIGGGNGRRSGKATGSADGGGKSSDDGGDSAVAAAAEAARNALRALAEHARGRAAVIGAVQTEGDLHGGGDHRGGGSGDGSGGDGCGSGRGSDGGGYIDGGGGGGGVASDGDRYGGSGAGGRRGGDTGRDGGSRGVYACDLDEPLGLSAADVASLVVAASSSEDDDDDDGDDDAHSLTAVTALATTPGAAATTTVAAVVALPDVVPAVSPPLLHAREARQYLRGARAAAHDFVRRHSVPVRACVVDVATFERQAAAASAAGAVPLSAIDAQIAARRMRLLRLHYGLAACALHRDAALLRRQLVDGLVERRRKARLRSAFCALAVHRAVSRLHRRWRARNPGGAVVDAPLRRLFRTWRDNAQDMLQAGPRVNRRQRLLRCWGAWRRALGARLAARRAERVRLLLQRDANGGGGHPRLGSSDTRRTSTASGMPRDGGGGGSGGSGGGVCVSPQQAGEALAAILQQERQDARRAAAIAGEPGADAALRKGAEFHRTQLLARGVRRWLGRVVDRARRRYQHSLAVEFDLERGGAMGRTFRLWRGVVRVRLVQRRAIAAEYALLVRCFKAWAVLARAHRNDFRGRVAEAKAVLHRRAAVLAHCFDAWVKFVDLPDAAVYTRQDE